MKNKLLPLALAATTAALIIQSGCSTASVRLMPGADGVHRVSVRDIEKTDAEEEAVKAAREYCEKHDSEAVFVETKDTKYTGSMDENTRNTVRKASGAAAVLGAPVGVGADAGAGAVLGSAGTVGYAMTSDKDYLSELKFKCQKN